MPSSFEKVTECTACFRLKHDDEAVPPHLGALLHSGHRFAPKHWREAYSMPVESIQSELWKVKAKLDEIPEKTYYLARQRVFPLSTGGGLQRKFTNRAGFKLLEVLDAVGVWDQIASEPAADSGISESECSSSTKNAGTCESLGIQLGEKRRKRVAPVIRFADLCGGPGSFSQALFYEGKRRVHRAVLRGYGMTLRDVDGLDWYPELAKMGEGKASAKHAFVATYGLDGTGDIYQLANVDALASLTGQGTVNLVVADGGFHVPTELSNYQETISTRITYAQWFANLKLQALGGCFVVKLFDTFSPFTRAMLYLTTFLYREVWIVKPRHSRTVNSERYLACLDFKGLPDRMEWMKYLEACFVSGFETDETCVPSLLPASVLDGDKTFSLDLQKANDAIASKQILALRSVIEEAEKLQRELVVEKSLFPEDSGTMEPKCEMLQDQLTSL